MWLEKKGDLIIIGQGMGENAYLFYDRFYGFIAKVDTPTPSKAQEKGVCNCVIYLSQQATESNIKRLVKEYCGEASGKLTFEVKYIDNDYVGRPTTSIKIDIE